MDSPAPWLPWQTMGQAKVQPFYRCTTKTLTSLEEVSTDILAAAEKNYSECLANEINEQMPGESSLEVYMKERESAKT
jgi:hypothetical protein